MSPHPEHRQFSHIFNKRTGVYDEDEQDLIKENTGVRVWSESYSSIDWIHDRIKEGVRLRKLRDIPGVRGRWAKASDASQAWILVIIIGICVAMIAWFTNVVQEWLSDLKQGYCTSKWRYNRQFCCWGKAEYETCSDWRLWPEVFNVESESGVYYTAMAMYTFVGLLFSLSSALMVKYSAEKLTMRVPAKPTGFSKSPSLASLHQFNEDPTYTNRLGSIQNFTKLKEEEEEEEERHINGGGEEGKKADQTKTETKTAYYSAGSGIPEVKVILGGFVIKGFLGFKTLFVKCIGLILSTSSGLNCGKEGPFVHFACSVANIACRIFPKFNKNESKKREILSAAAASGVAVAFGAPVGGVLFSLEEITNPFGTGKIVLFEVQYDKEYHLFELIPFLICGISAGFFGAAVTYYNIKFQHFRKRSFVGKYPVTEVMCIMILTALVSFWNPFTRLSLNDFALNLFSECSSTNDNRKLCAKTAAEIPQILSLLFAALIIKMGLTVVTFGCRVPGGVFLPGLVVGAVTGRMIGLIMQYLTLSYPEAWPFDSCAEDMISHGKCVIPGVYAIVGAAAGLTGVTRTTVSLVVIIFELTYSLTYAGPITIAVMAAKWTSDAMFPEGIYDLLIDLQQYPYLDSHKSYAHTLTIMELTEYLPTIDLDQTTTMARLTQKMNLLAGMGYGEDGGLPILSQGNILEGYIATSELSHAIEQVAHETQSYQNSLYPQNIDDTPIYFKAGQVYDRSFDATIGFSQPIQGQNDEEHVSSLSRDFSNYVDHAPLTIHHNASMEMLMDMFVKLGARYVCVTQSSGRFLGIVHKRRLLAYLKELEEE
ncbi:chloride channel [Phycomyces blakesleeanus]